MGGEDFDYRGSRIELTADRPRGLPFLKPLYGALDDLYPETVRVLK
jgi:hypothetical protein